MNVKFTNQLVEDSYIHVENGGQHVGFSTATHEFENGAVQKFLTIHFAQSHYGVRAETNIRVMNINQLQYLSEMIERAKALYNSDPAYDGPFSRLAVEVQLIDGLIVEKVYGPAEPMEGTTKLRQRVIAHNFRNPQTNEIVRAEQWSGPELWRVIDPEPTPHDGGSYDEEPEDNHDAGSYGESPRTLN